MNHLDAIPATEPGFLELVLAAGTGPRVTFVEGGSGTGKSRLLRKLATAARERGFNVEAFWGERESEYSPDAVAAFIARAQRQTRGRKLVIVEELVDQFEQVAPIFPRWNSQPPAILGRRRPREPREQVLSIVKRVLESSNDVVISAQSLIDVFGPAPYYVTFCGLFMAVERATILHVELDQDRGIWLRCVREPRARGRRASDDGQPHAH